MKKLSITFTTDINEARIACIPREMCPVEYVTDVLERKEEEIQSIKEIKQ